jgi:hypothetical protein
MKKFSNTILNIFITVILVSFSLIVYANPEQNYIVYIQDGLYEVKTDITGEIIYTSQDASVAIQWAIDNVTNNGIGAGEVLIEEGKYYLSKPIILKSNIWLHGKGQETELYTDGQIMQTITIQDASMTVVSDLSLFNKESSMRSSQGIVVERSVNCQVINVLISGYNQGGIVNHGESTMTLISENTLIDNSTNIRIKDGGGVIGRWLPLMISANEIRGGATGIWCGALVVNILNNTITDISNRGIVAATSSILLRGNNLSNIRGDYAIHASLAEFICTNNVLKNIHGSGIRTECRWGVITNNVVENLGLDDPNAVGIHVYSDTPAEMTQAGPAESKVIFKNRIKNETENKSMKHGILEDGIKNVIYENTIEGSSDKAILSNGKETLVQNNSIKK